ncbi:MAG: GxxExxY protein [Salinivirgaceae bacterium]|nr:MAG: GxxExxY protein [Salinivirgaceae bacterium]
MEYYKTKADVTHLSYEVTGMAIKVHKALGPGLLESVYEKCLKHELLKSGYEVKQQVSVPVVYDSIDIEANLRLDLLINDTLIVELKAIDQLLPIHEAQLMTYMKLLQIPQGLLINFNVMNITEAMKPFVNEYFKKLPNK